MFHKSVSMSVHVLQIQSTRLLQHASRFICCGYILNDDTLNDDGLVALIKSSSDFFLQNKIKAPSTYILDWNVNRSRSVDF